MCFNFDSALLRAHNAPAAFFAPQHYHASRACAQRVIMSRRRPERRGTMSNQLYVPVHARRVFVCAALAALLLALSVLTTAGAVAHAAPTAPTERLANSLLQFTAGGHALGFAREGVYIASADHALRVEFVGSAGAAPLADAAAAEPGRAQPLSQVTYTNVWQGVDVRYQAVNGGIVKSSYLVAAGADAGQIRLRYNAPVTLNTDGSLTAKFSTGQITESAPLAWQELDGARVPVPVSFHVATREASAALRELPFAIRDSLSANPEISFTLGAYDRARPLVIDPTLLWNTFMGSGGSDYGYGIAVDGSGNVYVVGYSSATWGAPVNPHAGGDDAFAAKLNGSGVRQWHTFMGSSGPEYGWDIAVDGSGNVYVTGNSGATWGSPVNGYAGGPSEAFIAKLDGTGALVWNTFMGASGDDWGNDITVDGSGNVYVVGVSDATWGSPVNGHAGSLDAFAAKLDSSGARQWNTFMGSGGSDYGNGIVVDGSGNVYIVGESVATWGPPVNPHAGGDDAFAAKLDSSGARQWNTFMGSSSADYGNGIVVDGSGNVYIVGESAATWGSPVNGHAGASDAFVAKLNGSGALLGNTFMGSSSSDSGSGIAIAGGNVYVVGYSYATWGWPMNGYAGNGDAFAAELNSNGVRQLNTFMGSSGVDWGNDIAIASGNVHVVGYSGATWGSPVNPYANGVDAFAAKLTTTTAVNVTGPQARVNPNNVTLKWRTTSETNIAGFDVYRQTGKREWKKINAGLIQAQHPGDAVGENYRFTDAQVRAGKRYRYKIQVWYLDGHNEWTASVRVKIRQ